MSLQNTLFLQGPQKCGKTTVGGILAEMLGVPLVDADRYLVDKLKKLDLPYNTIPELIDEEGYWEFRQLEYECIDELLYDGRVKILASGGGFICSSKFEDSGEIMDEDLLEYQIDKNQSLIKNAKKDGVLGKSVYLLHSDNLKTSAIYYDSLDKTIADENRDNVGKTLAVLNYRHPHYLKMSDHMILTRGDNEIQTAKKIIRLL